MSVTSLPFSPFTPSLMQELNKLRLVALTYGMPELLEVLSSVLLKEETTTSNPQIKTLQSCKLMFTFFPTTKTLKKGLPSHTNDTLIVSISLNMYNAYPL